VDQQENPWWKSFKDSFQDMKLKLVEEVFPAGTDGHYLREKGVSVFGFSPIINTPILLHDHNEFLNEETFLRGIDILYKVVLDMANVP
jgi:aminoacylase